MTEYRAHPLTILDNLGRVLYLTIIPVLRGFFYALQGDIGQWVQSAWIDICIFLLMIGIAVVRWLAVRYRYDNRELIVEKGWLLHRVIRMRWSNVTTISAAEAFYLRPFRAAVLRADTLGGSAGRADFSILVWRAQAEQLLQHGHIQEQHSKPRRYTPGTGSILALALLTSNSFGGILFLATFVSQAGRLVGRGFSDRLIGTVEQLARLLAFGLPPAAAATAYLLLAGWFAGFLLTFLRYKNFVISRSRHHLRIQGGIFSRREYCIRYPDINYIDIRQSILTRLLKLYSLYISAVGYAKHKDDIRCVIPTENHAVFVFHRQRLFPAFSPTHPQIRPKRTGFLRFIGAPLSLLAGLLAAMAILICLFPHWRSFFLFVGLMSLVPAGLFLAIRLVDFFTCGVAKRGKYYTIRYSKGLYLHTVVIPEHQIVAVDLRQGVFQRFTPNCDLLISTRAERKIVHRCRNLNMDELKTIFCT